MTSSARDPLYRRHRFPAEVIAHAVWLYLRFPLSLRMVEDLLAARGVIVSHQTVRLWVGASTASVHLDEVVISIGGKKHCKRRLRRTGNQLDSLKFHGRRSSMRLWG